MPIAYVEFSVGMNPKSLKLEHSNFGLSKLRTPLSYPKKCRSNSNFSVRTSNFYTVWKIRDFETFQKNWRNKLFLVANSKTILTKYASSGKINGNISLVFMRYFWLKKFLKGTNPKSPNFEHSNFGISELRTSRTLLLSSRLELNELEHPKNAELLTQTQVRSNTICSRGCSLIYPNIDTIFR